MAGPVRTGGAVVIVVPAFPFAMSPVDVLTGHVRRYTRRSMAQTFADAGLCVERLHYANSLGLIGYFAATTVLRMKPGAGPMVWCYDRFVAPATWFAERLVRPPFGQSGQSWRWPGSGTTRDGRGGLAAMPGS